MALLLLAVAAEVVAERDSAAEGQRVDEEQSSAAEAAVVAAVEVWGFSGREPIPFLNTHTIYSHLLTPLPKNLASEDLVESESSLQDVPS